MDYRSINFQQKLGLFSEQWQPKVIAEMNDYQFKVVKLQGDFVWHDHKETDETFIVIEGDLRIDFRDGAVHVSTGEMFVVPRGVDEPVLERVARRLGPVRHAELAVDVRQVELHRLLGDPELLADRVVRKAPRQRLQDRRLALGQAGGLRGVVGDLLLR